MTNTFVKAGAKSSYLRRCAKSVLPTPSSARSLKGVTATLCDVADLETGRPPVRGLAELARRARRAGQQRRHRRADREDRRHRAEDWRRCIDINLTGQYLCARPRRAAAQGGRRRQHHQSVFGRGPARLSVPHAVCRGEVGRGRLQQEPGDRGRPRQYPRQRDPAGGGRRRAHQPRDRCEGEGARASRSRREEACSRKCPCRRW